MNNSNHYANHGNVRIYYYWMVLLIVAIASAAWALQTADYNVVHFCDLLPPPPPSMVLFFAFVLLCPWSTQLTGRTSEHKNAIENNFSNISLKSLVNDACKGLCTNALVQRMVRIRGIFPRNGLKESRWRAESLERLVAFLLPDVTKLSLMPIDEVESLWR